LIQFLQPIWLWAITAVTVPLVIHLWNIREGRTLKVGSIALLTETARSQARSIRLSELLLLLLRCLLIILIALLLAGPMWLGSTTSGKQPGWILLPPANQQKVYAAFKQPIDSLLKTGFRLHHFQADFPEAKLGDSGQPQPVSYWSLLQLLNQKIPSGTPVYLFTDNQTGHFIGPRPATALDLHWFTLDLNDTATRTVDVFRTNTDSSRSIIAHTGSNGTFYTATNSSSSAPADTSAINIYIYADTYAADAKYLQAALAAIRDFSQRRIHTKLLGTAAALPASADWLFWLSDKPMPQSAATHTLAYAAGQARERYGAIITPELTAGLETYRLIDNKHPLTPLWTIADHSILLGRSTDNEDHYEFNSRFNPQWNNLVWHEQFPTLMAAMILENRAKQAVSMATIDAQQLQPAKVEASALLPKEQDAGGTPLLTICWLLAFCCLAAERWLSFHAKRRTA
jgi:hypothetical protein